MPLYTSAFGLICAAYLTPEVIATAPQLREPTSAAPGPRKSAAELCAIKTQGFSIVRGELIQGLDAIAVPVLDPMNELVACLATVGPSGSLDISESGPVVARLKRAASQFSEALG